MRIAICDDEKTVCAELENMLTEISGEIKCLLDIDVFYTGEELETFLLDGKEYEVIFLDIELKTKTGMEIGATIRDRMKNESIFIVYISSKSTYALSLFKTRPLDFLVKPLNRQDIEGIILKVNELINRNNTFFEFKIRQKTYRQKIKDILYFESLDKKVYMVTIEGKIEFYGKLSEIQKQINSFQFITIHKSYLINYQYVKSFEYDKVIMLNNITLPISQNNRNSVRRQQIALRKVYR
ncbi:MAG: response regulator transcription factor [Lachnospiraceae bacterium]|nr:response regulator transcription factor [Lachnospiraceae bacterium]